MTPDQDLSARLLPCPFCGGRPHSRTETDLDGFGRFYWFECGGCKARSGEKFATETCPQFYQDVRDAWNHRADHERAVQAAVAKAVEAATELKRHFIPFSEAEFKAEYALIAALAPFTRKGE